MFTSPIRSSLIVCRHQASNRIVQSSNIGRRNYAKDDKEGCCKDVVHSKGYTIEPWPKNDAPPPAWRPECPSEPQPVNYDPYRIKVPNIVVPPLPASNAKDSKYKQRQSHRAEETADSVSQFFFESLIPDSDYWWSNSETRLQDKETNGVPRLGYHGKNIYKYAFHEPWKPLDRLSLLHRAEKDESDRADTSVTDQKNCYPD